MLGHGLPRIMESPPKNFPAFPHPIGLMNPTHDPLPYKLPKEGRLWGWVQGDGGITPISRVVVTPSYPIIVPCIGSYNYLVGAHLVGNHPKLLPLTSIKFW